MVGDVSVLSRARALRWFAAHFQRQPSYGERYLCPERYRAGVNFFKRRIAILSEPVSEFANRPRKGGVARRSGTATVTSNTRTNSLLDRETQPTSESSVITGNTAHLEGR
jgi:hypothetical protein